MRAAPGEKLSRRVRSASVGASTVTVAIAAHGAAGGGLPTSSSLLLLAGVATVLASLTTAVPVLRRGVIALVPVLAVGQLAAHLALAVGHGHHAAVAAVGPLAAWAPMLGAHALALIVCAALIAAAERVGPRTEAALRAVVAALLATPPVVERPRVWLPVTDVHPVTAPVCRGAEPRRGPPVLV
ncbi:hypothetical protein GCM10023094_50250 [Rhodococcus olei]|uniref:Integral membrane protein n=1 Tax=Rhodococcus olei TaxID=2161675 RepID=A0ABP8PN75_9NOCA